MALPTKATHQQTRDHNVRLVLRTLYDYGPISRADVARRTNLTRTTVSDVVTELLGRGLLEEVGRGPSSGGKAPILLRVVPDARQVIALDLGDSSFKGALVDLRGVVSHAVELPVEGRNGEAALALVYQLVDGLMAVPRGDLLGIGVGTPGIIDTRSGTIRWAVNLDWQDLPLGHLLSERYGLPVNVANDSQAAALAEYTFGGEGAREPNVVVIKVGHGIGAGIVLGGELFHGDGFGAGEVGHVRVVEGGAVCRCGRHGCLETVASARAILERARELARDHPDTALARGEHAIADLTLEDVRAALEEGDPVACTVVQTAGRHLGAAIAGLLGALDVHRVVLQGPVTVFGSPWLDAVNDEAGRRSLPLLAAELHIDRAQIGEDAVLIGASALLTNIELGLSVGR